MVVRNVASLHVFLSTIASTSFFETLSSRVNHEVINFCCQNSLHVSIHLCCLTVKAGCCETEDVNPRVGETAHSTGATANFKMTKVAAVRCEDVCNCLKGLMSDAGERCSLTSQQGKYPTSYLVLHSATELSISVLM